MRFVTEGSAAAKGAAPTAESPNAPSAQATRSAVNARKAAASWRWPSCNRIRPQLCFRKVGLSMSTKNGSTKTPAAPQESAKQRPAHEIRLGRIKATIWGNQNDNG